MSEVSEKVLAGEVNVGDRVLAPDGSEITVTRIDPTLLGLPDLIAFVEDSETRWLKLPMRTDAEVEVIRAQVA